MAEFVWEDFRHPRLVQLRDQFHLDEAVAHGTDEFERQLLLKDRIHRVLPNGSPSRDYAYLSAFDILKDGLAGQGVYCTQFAFAYLQCAQSLGWHCRKLGVDTDHAASETDRHHGVVDIWSERFRKWYVIDLQNNLHYEKSGIPLNSLEIREEFLSDGARAVEGVVGCNIRRYRFSGTSTGYDTPSNYFWFFISLRNDFFTQPGLFDVQALLWTDRHNAGKIWYKGDGKNGPTAEHPMYASQFVRSADKTTCFPSMTNYAE